MVPMWMLPALSCGNSFVLKPSERDPSPGLRLAIPLEEMSAHDDPMIIGSP
jgi:malonate-semialdehyde dehydrogenase (acetylating) / methylmalonate-semialdehyde dehydrogenase